MSKKFSVLINKKINSYNKKISVDSDKSISHRCYIIASQCLGVSKIKALDSEELVKLCEKSSGKSARIIRVSPFLIGITQAVVSF